MSKKIQATIRWILTILLLCGVYSETGVWTVISLFLIFLGIEVLTVLINRIKK